MLNATNKPSPTWAAEGGSFEAAKAKQTKISGDNEISFSRDRLEFQPRWRFFSRQFFWLGKILVVGNLGQNVFWSNWGSGGSISGLAFDNTSRGPGFNSHFAQDCIIKYFITLLWVAARASLERLPSRETALMSGRDPAESEYRNLTLSPRAIGRCLKRQMHLSPRSTCHHLECFQQKQECFFFLAQNS